MCRREQVVMSAYWLIFIIFDFDFFFNYTACNLLK